MIRQARMAQQPVDTRPDRADKLDIRIGVKTVRQRAEGEDVADRRRIADLIGCDRANIGEGIEAGTEKPS